MAERPSPIERGFFRDTGDGATVFFPWGLTHRGYRLPDAAAKKRAARAASLLVGSAIAAGTWGGHALHQVFQPDAPSAGAIAGALAVPLALIALIFVAYAVWVARFVEPFPASDLKISREERLREAAALVPRWKLTAAGALLAAPSTLLVVLEPRAWWLGALGVAMGAGLALWGRVLHQGTGRDACRPPAS